MMLSNIGFPQIEWHGIDPVEQINPFSFYIYIDSPKSIDYIEKDD
jgi:hypothetical protein